MTLHKSSQRVKEAAEMLATNRTDKKRFIQQPQAKGDCNKMSAKCMFRLLDKAAEKTIQTLTFNTRQKRNGGENRVIKTALLPPMTLDRSIDRSHVKGTY